MFSEGRKDPLYAAEALKISQDAESAVKKDIESMVRFKAEKGEAILRTGVPEIHQTAIVKWLVGLGYQVRPSECGNFVVRWDGAMPPVLSQPIMSL